MEHKFTMTMPGKIKVLSIRQPWAWLIVSGYKDIENRDWKWKPKYRGRLYIHASSTFTRAGYFLAARAIELINPAISLPRYERFETGGIVGRVNLVDVVTESESRWFFGPVGLVLSDPEETSIIPCKGQLGIFELPGVDNNE